MDKYRKYILQSYLHAYFLFLQNINIKHNNSITIKVSTNTDFEIVII